MMVVDTATKLVLALILHEFGDYCTQSDWMASEKVKKSSAAIAHAIVYTLPFLLITRHPITLGIVFGTHFVLDRFRLAKYWCWFKNFLAPRSTKTPVYATIMADQLIVSKLSDPPGTPPRGPAGEPITHTTTVRYEETRWWYPWSDCSVTGYHKDKPAWLTVWLMIRADNAMHHICNAAAILFFG